MRRRIISPDFFSDPDIIANLDFGGRLFYQGLWCIAEDSGVFDPNLLGLKMKIFPGDNIELSVIENYYKTLVGLGKIIEFTFNGRKYAWLKNFHKHQKVDKPSPPSLPLPNWIVWHGEEEFGKDRRDWYYEILNESVPIPGQFQDNSRNIPGQDMDESPDESGLSKVKRSEVKRSEVKLSEGKGKKARARRSPHAQKEEPPKIQYAEYVFLTEEQYQKLVSDYSLQDAQRLIEILNNYKASKGVSYESDYHAILNWGVKRLEEEKARAPTAGRVPHAYASLMALAQEIEQEEPG